MARRLKKVDDGVTGIFDGLDVGPQAMAEVQNIARQIKEVDGQLSPADASQLRELAVLLQRQTDAADFAKAAKDVGDAKEWLNFTRMGEHLTTSKRGLLRDLKVTRFFKPLGSDKVADQKANQKSGKSWQGVI